jgi:hypothetical protein
MIRVRALNLGPGLGDAAEAKGAKRMRAGDLILLSRAASPQFVKPIGFRVIREEPATTAEGDGWVWLDGYEVDDQGEAVERRLVFVQRTGVRPLPPARR